MCEPTTLAYIAIATATVGTAAGVISANQTANAQVKAINEANAIQSQQISEQAGQALSEEARAARRERAAQRAAASESGINLGSNSFLAALQASAINQFNNNGVILANEAGQQANRASQANSQLANISIDTFLSGGIKVAAAGAQSYMANADAFKIPTVSKGAGSGLSKAGTSSISASKIKKVG